MYPCQLVFLLPTFQVGLYALYFHFTPLSIGFTGFFEKIQKNFPVQTGARKNQPIWQEILKKVRLPSCLPIYLAL